MKKILLTCLTAFYYCVSAQVGPPQAAGPNTNNGYALTQSSGTYTPLSANRTIWQSGATMGTDLVSGAIPLPTPFTYNNQKYSSVYISNNGFITLGVPAANTTYTGLSTDVSPTTYDGAFAGFAVNLRHASTTTSEIAYETVGSKFIVQYTDVQGNTASAAQLINFQIQLDLTAKTIAIVYGNCVSGSATLSGQVGIRGSESSDTNNLTGTNWTALTPGTTISSNPTLGTTNGTTVPVSGLTFTYTPGTWQTAPQTYATLPFTENFSTWADGNSTLDLPNANYWRTWPARGDNSWRQSDITTTGFTSASGWGGTGGSSTASSSAVAPAARFHSYNCQNASGYMDLYVNLSSGTGNRFLSFDYINPSGTDVLKIQLSTDGGNTFTDVGSTFGVAASWITNFVDLGSSSPNAVVRFLAKGDNGSDDIYVDNVKITTVTIPDCAVVTTPANAATGLSITPNIKWNATAGATSYKLSIGTTPGGTNVMNGVDVGNVLTYTIPTATPLLYGVTYYATVSPTNNYGTATACNGSSFTTKNIGCPTVSAPSSAAAGVSVTPTITWGAVTDATGYKLSIGTTAGGTDVMNNTDLGNVLTYTLAAPLNNSTKYFYTVNAYTSTSNSASCTERNFTTVCSAENAPTVSQGFTAFTPSCWSVAKGDVTASSTLTYGSSKWTAEAGFANAGSNSAVRLNLYGNNTGDWLVSQGINLGATPGMYRIRYKMAVTSYLATVSQTTLGTHQVRIIISTDGGTTWSNANTLKTYTGAGTYSNTGQTETVDLVGYSGTIKIAFVATTSSTSPDIDFHIDDFIVEAIPTCQEPSSPVVANPTVSSATLSWTAPASLPAGGYEYYYSTNSTTPVAATAASGTSNATSVQLSGLASSSLYYVWVRSVCSTGDKSPWIGYASFNTLCGTAMAPFAQNFDAGIAPNCWNNVNPMATTTDATLFWKFSGSADYGASAANNGKAAGTYAWVDASTPYTGAGANTVQLVTPPINLTGLTSPYVSFDWFKNHSTLAGTTVGVSTYDNNKLTVEVNDGNGWVSVFSDNSNLNQWRTVGIPLAASYIGATVQVRFTVDKNVSNNGYYYDDVLLDNVEVKQNPNLGTSEVAAKINSIKVYPNPFTDTLSISDISKVQSVSVIDVAGRLVRTIDHPSSVLELRYLKEGMYLVVLNMKDGSKQTVKAIKK
ncbi:T9SS type A sorting domain-containing protein [Chryseobacterium sp. MEBOG06]|uniref:T9SS type A sorting domain-containing protein n=1 Tax=Chryseobacterium sp. MEBOG06 TaxID=2879938 RepID=UPI001F2159A7|nr:T9SS type A sorting domain-containing protein [Chryseobacterium sp. MEBOG06]UKB85328.1 T9SS type A sorting domain-containing protein [Chryseobacterium sp. MEBOG06]